MEIELYGKAYKEGFNAGYERGLSEGIEGVTQIREHIVATSSQTEDGRVGTALLLMKLDWVLSQLDPTKEEV